MDSTSEFSHNLIRLRKVRHWSQEQLAEQSGISVRTIQRIEKTSSQPRNHTLKTLARVFDVSVEELTVSRERDCNLQPIAIDKLRKLNAAALSLILIPFGNLIAPWMLWQRYKNDIELNESYRQMISFHLLWSAVTLSLLALTPPITQAITGSVALGKFPLLFVVYCLMVIANIVFVLRAAKLLNQNKTQIFSFVPKLF